MTCSRQDPTRLCSPDSANRIRWRLNIVVHLAPFLSALPVVDEVGTKNMATDNSVKVNQNKYINN